ncbi:MAG TPA: glutamate-cysteine ligase family protein [Gemmatimonadaceae bacterium]|nr:glutamate-cysteine ligase family protein [Gemmatimonadaceae bacterium]
MTAAPRLERRASGNAAEYDPPLDRDALARDLRDRVFPHAAPVDVAPRVGAEVEIIPVDSTTGRPLRLDGRGLTTLSILRRAGESAGWHEHHSAKANVLEIELPDGGRITFEPGGQIEISSAPNASLSALVVQLRDTVARIREAAPTSVELLAKGVDPRTRVEDVAPQLDADRYRRMLAHFDRIGPSGARMMRQTASFQVCVDGGSAPELTWRVLNAVAPYVVAMFANSSRYAGCDTGHRSYRRHIWATLDPRRTGLLGRDADPIAEYLRFALGAPAFLMPKVAGASATFGHWLSRGVTASDWCTHLSTLFPEVRPRGYFELRSADVVAPEWYAVPLVLVAGLVYHRPSLDAANDLLGAPDPALLARSGLAGLSDPTLGARAPLLCDLALAGCEALGTPFVSAADIGAAAEFFDRYTRLGRSPSDD